jgi:hypothetical protein
VLSPHGKTEINYVAGKEQAKTNGTDAQLFILHLRSNTLNPKTK